MIKVENLLEIAKDFYITDMAQGCACGDCGMSRGEPHQDGCDMDECLICHGQLLSCACDKELKTKVKGIMSNALFKIGQEVELWELRKNGEV